MIFFLFLHEHIGCVYWLKAHQQGSSEYPKTYIFKENWENYLCDDLFYLELCLWYAIIVHPKHCKLTEQEFRDCFLFEDF